LLRRKWHCWDLFPPLAEESVTDFSFSAFAASIRKLKAAAVRLETLRMPDGEPIPPNAFLGRSSAILGATRS
jgi:hypothetical protein